MSNRIQIRRGTTTDWENTNIVLSSGELGFDFERNILKIGTGFTPWNDLEPFGAGATVTVGPEAPAEPEIGNLWFDSVSGSLFVYLDDGTTEAWIETTGNNGVANITIRETAPANPNPGELWWNSTTGILYIYYVDETSGQWVDATYGTGLAAYTASDLAYDNAESSLIAEDVQEAIDEIDGILFGKMSVDGLNSNIDTLTFQNMPNGDPLQVGELRLEENLPVWQISGNTKHLIGQQLLTRARNRTGAQRGVGDPVFISGVFTPGGGPGTNIMEYELADRDVDPAIFAVTSCPANDNADGCIITRGVVRGWNTSGFTAGDKLYLTDTPGQYTTTEPATGPVFFVGKVIRAATQGIVFVSPQLVVTLDTIGAEPANANIQSHITDTENPHAVDAAQVGLGNVTNESKATMFTDAALTGVPTAPTAAAQTDTTQIATTAFVQGELSSLALGDTNIIEEIQAEGTPLDITAKAVNVTRAALGAGTGNADVFDFTATILAADEWTDEDGYYTLEKTISGILNTDNPVADLDLENALVANISDIQDAWAEIYQIVTTTDTVTFYALEEPVFPEDTVVSFEVVR